MTKAAFGLELRVPPEILAKIFLHTIDHLDTLELPPRQPGSECPQWALRSVCSSWRQVALQEYRLWNNINVPRWWETRHDTNFLDRVQEILPPRGPLSISITCYSKSFTDKMVDKIVIPRLSRIIKLHIHANLSPESKLWSLPPESFSSIRDILFVFPNDCHYAPPINGSLQSEQGSHLNTRIPSMPWSQLTHIDLCSVCTHDISSILSQCYFLESFRAQFAELCDGLMPIPKKHLTLPFLTSVNFNWGHFDNFFKLGLPWAQMRNVSLCGKAEDKDLMLSKLNTLIGVEELEIYWLVVTHNVIGTYGLISSSEIRFSCLHTLSLVGYGMLLFPAIVAPMLENLALSGGYGCCSREFPSPARQIMSVLRQSGCSLKVFTYNNSFLDHDQSHIESLLLSLDSLQKFSAPYLNLGENVLKKIGEGVLLPELRHFVTLVESLTLFVDVVENRVKKMGSSLREGKVHLVDDYQYNSPGTKAAWKRLKHLNASFGCHFILQTRMSSFEK